MVVAHSSVRGGVGLKGGDAVLRLVIALLSLPNYRGGRVVVVVAFSSADVLGL